MFDSDEWSAYNAGLHSYYTEICKEAQLKKDHGITASWWNPIAMEYTREFIFRNDHTKESAKGSSSIEGARAIQCKMREETDKKAEDMADGCAARCRWKATPKQKAVG